MAKASKLSLIATVILVFSSLACSAVVHPTVSFAFNSATFEYAWTVNYPTDATVSFSKLQVFPSLPMGSWTDISGAWANGANEGWNFVAAPNGDGTYGFYWQASANQTRTVGSGAWTGVFKIKVPGSEPVVGWVQTSGSVASRNNVSSYVPQIVPEPSSLAIFGSMLGGLVPMVLKRKKS